jgi:hypothetical protein
MQGSWLDGVPESWGPQKSTVQDSLQLAGLKARRCGPGISMKMHQTLKAWHERAATFL